MSTETPKTYRGYKHKTPTILQRDRMRKRSI
jgi:hypothetical protein